MTTTSFREVDKTHTDVYLDEKLLGAVKMNLWTQKWSMHPNFWHKDQSPLYENYLSSYEAGKAMKKLYEDTKSSINKAKASKFNLSKNTDSPSDTDEIDMRDVFNSWGP